MFRWRYTGPSMRLIQPVTEQMWLEVAHRSREATFFHSPLWHRLAALTWPQFRDVSAGITLPGGARVIVPLLETRRSVKGFFRDLVSSFADRYGGPIADRTLSEDDQDAVYHRITWQQRIGRLSITGNPLARQAIAPDGFAEQACVTHILSLAPGHDRIVSGFSETARNRIDGARDEGVETGLVTSLEDYHVFHELHQSMLPAPYPARLFDNAHAMARRYGRHMQLWLAKLDRSVVAGTWVFYWNQHVVCWLPGAREDDRARRGATLLHAEIIKDACERGFGWYDFNTIDMGDDTWSVHDGFGAERRPVPRYTVRKNIFETQRAGGRR